MEEVMIITDTYNNRFYELVFEEGIPIGVLDYTIGKPIKKEEINPDLLSLFLKIHQVRR